MAKQRAEPFLWLLFSAGGVAAALFIPAMLVLFGIAFPLGWISAPDFDHVHAVAAFPLTRIVVFGVCVLALFHWAHRFRYTLYEGLQLKHLGLVVSVFCYGGAVVGSGVTAYLLIAGL